VLVGSEGFGMDGWSEVNGDVGSWELSSARTTTAGVPRVKRRSNDLSGLGGIQISGGLGSGGVLLRCWVVDLP
jgi:hypothetical protein